MTQPEDPDRNSAVQAQSEPSQRAAVETSDVAASTAAQPSHRRARAMLPTSEAGPIGMAALHARMVDAHAPATLLVSAADQVAHVSSQAGRYLLHRAGPLSAHVLKLIRSELRVELRAALAEARRLHGPVVSRPVKLAIDGLIREVAVHVTPSVQPGETGFALVVFEDREAIQPRASARGSRNGLRVRELENELGALQQRVDTLLDDYQRLQDEFQSSNEHLRGVNDALRSTTTALTTSEEALRSSRIELELVNENLQHTADERAQLATDLGNLLSAADVAALFVDRELAVTRFTAQTISRLGMRTSDRGLPLSAVMQRMGWAELVEDAASVLRDLRPIERQVEDSAGRTYLSHVLPYRAAGDRIAGIVIAFVDVTLRRQTEKERGYIQHVFDTFSDALLVLSPTLRVRTANAAFYRQFHARQEDTVGRLIYDLGNRQWDIPALRTLLEQVLPHDLVFDNYEVTHDFHSIGHRVMLLNARKLEAERMILLGIRDITEQQRAEQALRESEQRYRLLVESAQEYAIVLFDVDGVISVWGGGAQRIFGWSEAEAVGQPGEILFTAEDRAAGIADLEISIAASTGQAMDDRWQTRKDGSHFWASGVMQALREESGALRGFAKVLRDNTHKKQAEEALRASEARFRAMAETVPDALFTTTASGEVDYVNRQFEDMTGTSVPDVLGTQMWPQLIHPDDHQRAAQAWAEARAHRRRFEARYRLRNPQGTFCWVIVRARPLFSEPGQLAQWIGTVTDIDALTRAEEEVRELNKTLEERVEERTRELRDWKQQLDRLIEASNAITWTTDAHGVVVDDSPSWREFTGQTYAQWKGEGWLAAIHPDDRDVTRAAWRHSVKYSTPVDLEYRVHHASSRTWRWMNVRAFPLRDENKAVAGWIGMNVDIHARKRSEMQVRELASRLAVAEQQERHRIAQILHDELQQQLYSARIQAVQLMRRAEANASSEEIATEARRLYEELGETISATRQLSIDLWPPSIGEGLAESFRWLATQMEDSYQLGVDVEVADLPPNLDESFRVLLFRITRELLFNVVKHADTDSARVELRQHEGMLVLKVCDQGRGFEVRDREDKTSSAFGLYGIRDRLRLFDGEMDIESHPGNGTTVAIRVPMENLRAQGEVAQ